MDIQAEPIKSLKSVTLDLPPSCIEFCPARPEYFVVGTYNLQQDPSEAGEGDGDVADPEENNDNDDIDDEARQQAKQPQSRNGSLLLFSLKDADM